MKKLKIGYFGDGVWAHNAFRKIVNDAKFKIAFVVLRYDSSDEVLATLAKEQNIPILKEKNIHKYYNIAEIKSLFQTYVHIMLCRYCKFYALLPQYNKT